jgi:CubicO group peptidase (beta-lactamase class C family)
MVQTGTLMITRRGVIQAAVAYGLAGGCFRSAMAQQPKRKAKRTPKKSPASPAPVQADERVNDVLAPVRDEHHLPGLLGAIVAGDRLATIGAVGIRKIGSPEPIRVTDQIHVGSCTKAMTATLIGMLVEQGKLSWGSTIREVFPDQAERIHPDIQVVTLSQLLTHRAGLPHDVRWWSLPGETPTDKRLSIMASMLAEPPRHRPGTTYEYSNVGYAIAGLMAETVTGRSWEELMKERLFDPLEMASAGFGPPGRPGTVDQPWGHRSVGGRVEPAQRDNPPSMGPAGTVHCSIPDWGRFAALHLAAARGRPRLLKASTFRALHTPPPGAEYAGGWLVCQRTWAGGQAFSHNGSNTMWFATVWLAPALNLAFLAVTNQGGKEAETATDEAIVALIRSREFLLGLSS